MRLFRNDFQRNVQHSIHTSDITKRNSNVHFILGNTVHARPGLTVIVINKMKLSVTTFTAVLFTLQHKIES